MLHQEPSHATNGSVRGSPRWMIRAMPKPLTIAGYAGSGSVEGQRPGRAPLDVDRAAIVHDRMSGISLTKVAKRHRVSRATVVRRFEARAV